VGSRVLVGRGLLRYKINDVLSTSRRRNAKTSRRFVGNNTRATIYFAPDIFKAVRMKSAATHRSISEIVNEAVKETLAEDAVDLDAVQLLRDEPVTTFESFVSDLRRRGTLYEAIASESDRRRVLWAIGGLKDNPRPRKASRLPEHENHLRMYVEHYRVIYEIDDSQRQVTVFRIAHRRRQNSAG